jgi:small GTP-binding protein
LTYKICIFGESGVGKTSLVQRFVTNQFDHNTKPTLGAAIHVKHFEMDRKIILLQIWDFGGEDRFRFLLPSYAKGAFGGIFMYDISRKETLENYEEWVSVFQSGLPENRNDIPILLVGGKSDLEHHRECTEEDISPVYKSEYFFDIIECSAKIGENVDYVFKTLINEIMKNLNE